MRSSRVLAVLLGLVLGATPLLAQGEHQRASANLLGIPFGVVSAEYEYMATRELSWGLGAGIDNNTHSWAEAKIRFYPGARGPDGLAVGMTAGVDRLRAFTGNDCLVICTEGSGPKGTAFTLGVLLDYGWLIGPTERFYVGTGVGAKRVYGLDDERDTDGGFITDYPKVLPVIRFQIGYTF
jgi:hypothetical protein